MNDNIVSDKFKEKCILLDNGSIMIDFNDWESISQFVYDSGFDYLMCITSYDLQFDDKLGLAYNFYSTSEKKYLEIRIEFNNKEEIFSIANIWRTADWHEREAYDLMGILFKGHPLRKDWKEPEYYNGMPVPKDKSYWE